MFLSVRIPLLLTTTLVAAALVLLFPRRAESPEGRGRDEGRAGGGRDD
jgi:hypothetical protein